jgi:tryptophan 2,3-dioxygenase
MLENRLGLRPIDRLQHGQHPYSDHLQAEQKKSVLNAETSPNLFTLVQSWLERTPFLDIKEFDFWQSYISAVQDSFALEISGISRLEHLSADEKHKAKTQTELALKSFEVIFNPSNFEKAKADGDWLLSFKAVRAALLIQLYRDQPVFQLPFSLLSAVQDLDSNLTQWRYRHTLLARKMLGAKIGTGGSSGAKYLQGAADQHRIFKDLNQLVTFFIPRTKLPKLPHAIEERLGFYFTSGQDQNS